MSQYKLVVFDFDGTLADSFVWFVKAVNFAAERYNFDKILDEELENLRNYSARQMINHLNVSKWKMPFIARHMRRSMKINIGKIQLFKGVSSLFDELHSKGIKIAIVSTSSYESIARILGKENAEYVDYFECSVSIFGKPAKIKKVLKKSGMDKRDVILIGDEIRDIHAARNVSIDVGVVPWGYTKIESLNKSLPDKSFKDMKDIITKVC